MTPPLTSSVRRHTSTSRGSPTPATRRDGATTGGPKLLPEAPDDALDALIARASQAASPTSVIVLGRTGGAIRNVADDATALSGRSAAWQVHFYASWTDLDDARNIARASEEALRPWRMRRG